MKITSLLKRVTVVDYDGSGTLDDELHKKHRAGTRGAIGLQIHSYHELRLRLKDIRIKELAPSGTAGGPGVGEGHVKAVEPASRARPIPSVKALADQLPCILDYQVCDEFFQCQELVDFVAAHVEETVGNDLAK
jgi:hypothetical protein